MQKIFIGISKRSHLWILFLISITIFILILKSPVSYAGGDSRWTLLTAQSIIENHTIRLDKYADIESGYSLKKGNQIGYAIETHGGHLYNFFPLGSSLSSLPFTWVETQIFGNLMKIHSYNSAAQKRIAATLAVAIFILLYMIANFYISSGWSILVSLGFWLGTSLSSVLGQGLWSHTFAVFYIMLSIFFTLQIKIKNKDKHWILLGLTLFMAYLSRPTLSLASPALLSYLFFNQKRIVAFKTAIVFLLLFGVFVFFSYTEFNQFLPAYYMPKRLSSDGFTTALLANTLSPSRGLFIFSPFLLLFFLDLKDSYKIIKNDKTLLIIVIWIAVHTVVVSKFPHWSAGWCYGPRFMVDILPATFLLFVILLKKAFAAAIPAKKIVLSIFLVAASLFSISIHIPKGLYERYSAVEWNRFPAKLDSYYFNWQFPQFLHTKKRQDERICDYKKNNSLPITPKEIIPHNSPNVCFMGWSQESKYIWSLDTLSTIKFKIDDIDTIRGTLDINIGTNGLQEIQFILNDHYVGKKTVISFGTHVTFKFDKNLLMVNKFNTIEFIFPNAHRPGNGDPRKLAIALESFVVE